MFSCSVLLHNIFCHRNVHPHINYEHDLDLYVFFYSTTMIAIRYSKLYVCDTHAKQVHKESYCAFRREGSGVVL